LLREPLSKLPDDGDSVVEEEFKKPLRIIPACVRSSPVFASKDITHKFSEAFFNSFQRQKFSSRPELVMLLNGMK
jgi:hypothetical protein